MTKEKAPQILNMIPIPSHQVQEFIESDIEEEVSQIQASLPKTTPILQVQLFDSSNVVQNQNPRKRLYATMSTQGWTPIPQFPNLKTSNTQEQMPQIQASLPKTIPILEAQPLDSSPTIQRRKLHTRPYARMSTRGWTPIPRFSNLKLGS